MVCAPAEEETDEIAAYPGRDCRDDQYASSKDKGSMADHNSPVISWASIEENPRPFTIVGVKNVSDPKGTQLQIYAK